MLRKKTGTTFFVFFSISELVFRVRPTCQAGCFSQERIFSTQWPVVGTPPDFWIELDSERFCPLWFSAQPGIQRSIPRPPAIFCAVYGSSSRAPVGWCQERSLYLSFGTSIIFCRGMGEAASQVSCVSVVVIETIGVMHRVLLLYVRPDTFFEWCRAVSIHLAAMRRIWQSDFDVLEWLFKSHCKTFVALWNRACKGTTRWMTPRYTRLCGGVS